MAESNFEKGKKLRMQVLGKEHVENSFKNADAFSKPLQELLAALNRQHELAVHMKGALNNGLTRDEIREALIHIIPYAGFPAAADAFRTAKTVLDEVDGKG